MKDHPAARLVNLLGRIADGKRELCELYGSRCIMTDLHEDRVLVTVFTIGHGPLNFVEGADSFPSDALKAKIMLVAG